MEFSATRQRIMDSVIAVADSKGTEQITTKNIAANAKLSEGSIYKNFLNKEELYESTLFYIYSQIGDAITVAMKGKVYNNIIDKFYDYWDVFITFWVEHYGAAKFFASYRTSSVFTVDVMKKVHERLPSAVKQLTLDVNMFSSDSSPADAYWKWSLLVDGTLSLAKYEVTSKVKDSQRRKDMLDFFKKAFNM